MKSMLLFLLAGASGIYAQWCPGVARLPIAARVPLYVCFGIVTITVEMFLLSVLAVPWSLPLLLLLPVGAGVIALWRKRFTRSDRVHERFSPILLLAMLILVLVFVIVLAGAATSFDLLFFWGTKGQRFGMARGIDLGFLRDPAHKLMHPDYPPLVPLLYAWMTLGSTQLDWFAAIATTPLFLLLLALGYLGFAQMAGAKSAAHLTTLCTTMFGALFIQNYVAGNAEPALLFFETIALGALTAWHQGEDDSKLIAAVALTGTTLTKVEGLVFTVLCILAFGLFSHRRLRQRLLDLLTIGFLPATAAASWLLFVRVEKLTDAFSGQMYGSFSAERLGSVIALVRDEGSYDMFFLPWIAAGIALALSARIRQCVPHVAAALMFGLFLLYVFAQPENATYLIVSSARRVLLTPLLLLLVGAAAAGASSNHAHSLSRS